MENDKRNTCEATMRFGKRCARALYDGEKCICHSEKENKDVELLQKELDKIFADDEAEINDLTRFILPKQGCKLPREYKRDTYFTWTRFLGKVDFREVKFSGEADFTWANFSEEADFIEGQFLKVVDFNLSNFTGEVRFGGCRFSQEARFQGAKISEEGNFVDAKFLGDADFAGAEFSGKTVFRRAEFAGRAEFYSTKFFQSAVFDSCKCSGEAVFSSAEFRGKADFAGTKFSARATFTFAHFWEQVNFRLAQFWGIADFSFADFSADGMFRATVFNQWVSFAHCGSREEGGIVFDGEAKKRLVEGADFSHLTFAHPNRIVFRKLDLGGCLFLESDISRVQFIDVDWPIKGRCFRRKAIYDETSPDSKWLLWNEFKGREKIEEPPKYQYELIAQVYRRLQANYITNYRFPEAGDFYIGEQEMMRKAKGKIGQFLSTNFLYLLISRYGESFTLPFLWLLLTLFVFPGLLLYGGVNLDYDSQTTGFVKMVNYDWTWSPKDLLPLKSDYWNTLAVNLSFVTFHRSEITTYLPQILQRAMVNLQILLVIALAAFFLLALRRKFKRKSF